MDDLMANIVRAKAAATVLHAEDLVAFNESEESEIQGYLNETAIGYVDGSGGGLWREQLRTSHPSDYFELDKDTWKLAIETVENAGYSGLGVPSDLSEAGMVPMEDCLMYIPYVSSYVRVCAKLGYFVFDIRIADASVSAVFEIVESDGKLILDPHDVKLVPSGNMRLTFDEVCGYLDKADTYLVYDDLFKAWYGLMVLLLNPATQEVLMERKGKEKLRQKCLCPKKTRERKAVYVKRHKLDGDIWDEVSRRNGIERRTLSWYVIGHWRECKTGKRVFVKPHWKGPLRELQRNFDTNRKREFKAYKAS